jgi:hypothetical protein
MRRPLASPAHARGELRRTTSRRVKVMKRRYNIVDVPKRSRATRRVCLTTLDVKRIGSIPMEKSQSRTLRCKC